jgi:hypothetical protein
MTFPKPPREAKGGAAKTGALQAALPAPAAASKPTGAEASADSDE